MGRIDSTAKNYLRRKDVFADIINYVVYGGVEVVASGNLRELDTSQIVLPKAKKENGKETSRDSFYEVTVMESDDAVYVIRFGLEAQTLVDNTMPARDLLYAAMDYDKQIREIRAQNRKGKKLDRTTFLSGFTGEDRLKPVVTITVYFGAEKPWDGPLDLYSMFEREIPMEARAFICNWKINLLQPAFMESKEIEKFRSDMREVAKFLKVANDEEKCSELLNSDEKMKKLDSDTADMLQVVTGRDLEFTIEMDGKVNMCKAFDDHKARGKAEGLAEGIAAGKVEGKAEGKLEERERLVKAMLSKGFSTSEISSLADIPEEEVCLLLAEHTPKYNA